MAMPRQGQDMSRGHDSRLSRTLINCNFMMRVAEPGWLAGRRQRAVRAYQNGCLIGAQDGPDRQREPDCRGESHRCRHLGVEPMARAEGEGPKGETSSAGSLLTRRWREVDSNSWSRFEKTPFKTRHTVPCPSAGESGTTRGDQKLEPASFSGVAIFTSRVRVRSPIRGRRRAHRLRNRGPAQADARNARSNRPGWLRGE